MSRTSRPRTPQAFHTQRRGFTGKTIDVDADEYATADLALTMRIAEKLEAHYPAHPWMVQVSHKSGCAFIALPLVMKRNEKYVLHIDKLKMDPSLRAVVRAGGELLERHNIPRAGFALDHFLTARQAGPLGRRPAPRLILE